MTPTAPAVFWLRAALGRSLGSDAIVLAEPSDWSAVHAAAGRHNLEPLLFDLVERGLVAVPDATRKRWEGQYYRNQIFNHSLFEMLAAILAAAAEASAVVIPLKGPVAVARRFLDPGLRVMVDLDLLCRQKDLAVLAGIATRLGFEAQGENSIYHLAFSHPELGLGLEFHFDLYEVLAERREFIEELVAGADQLKVGEVSFPAPSEPAEIVLQLGHLLNHDYGVDLRHWFDFALATSERGSLDDQDQRDLMRLLRLTDLEPEYLEAASIVGELFGINGVLLGPSSKTAVFAGIEASLRNLTDHRPFLSGARVQSAWWPRARYAARLLIPAPQRWRALAAAEESSVATALFRHLKRAFGRGRVKLERPDSGGPPTKSPRARLFQRRERGLST